MIVITAFDQQQKPLVNLALSKPEDAATMAHMIATQYAKAVYVRIMDGAWKIVFPSTFPVSKARLAHIVQHRANVEFA